MAIRCRCRRPGPSSHLPTSARSDDSGAPPRSFPRTNLHHVLGRSAAPDSPVVLHRYCALNVFISRGLARPTRLPVAYAAHAAHGHSGPRVTPKSDSILQINCRCNGASLHQEQVSDRSLLPANKELFRKMSIMLAALANAPRQRHCTLVKKCQEGVAARKSSLLLCHT